MEEHREGDLPTLGKISPEFFERVIRPHLGAPSDRVRVGPQHGVDFGVVEVAEGIVMALTTDPLFVVPQYGWERAAWFAVHILASDAATSGLPLSFATFDLNLPPSMTEREMEALWRAIHRECSKLGLSIVTGHTARYEGCSFPMVGGATFAALGSAQKYVTPAMAEPGDEVIVTKGPAIETTGLFGATFPGKIEEALGTETARQANQLFEKMSVVEDCRTVAAIGVRQRGVTAMHDATECGLFGGLVELAQASGVGLKIDKSSIRFPTWSPECVSISALILTLPSARELWSPPASPIAPRQYWPPSAESPFPPPSWGKSRSRAKGSSWWKMERKKSSSTHGWIRSGPLSGKRCARRARERFSHEKLRLYLITDSDLCHPRPLLDVVAAALQGGVTAVQLRNKKSTPRELLTTGESLRRLSRKHHSCLIVNDRIDLALALESEGVHVGSEDLPPLEARRLMPSPAWLGVSARTEHEAKAAERAGADYLGVGPVFSTSTKPDAGQPIGLERLSSICQTVSIPVVGIGGIDPHNATSVVKAGAAGVAVISVVMVAPDPEVVARALLEQVHAALG